MTRALFETECRFFNNTEEVAFAEGCEHCDATLSDREKTVSLLDKRSCCSERVLVEAQDTLKSYYVKHYAQCEVHNRESLITLQQQQENGIDTDNDEEDVSDVSNDDDNIFSFATSESVDDTIVKNNLSEDELKIKDAEAASYEHNIVVLNWIAYKVPLKKHMIKDN